MNTRIVLQGLIILWSILFCANPVIAQDKVEKKIINYLKNDQLHKVEELIEQLGDDDPGQKIFYKAELAAKIYISNDSKHSNLMDEPLKEAMKGFGLLSYNPVWKPKVDVFMKEWLPLAKNKGAIPYNNGQYDKALPIFIKLSKVDKSADLAILIAICADKTGDKETAYAYYHLGIDAGELDPDVHGKALLIGNEINAPKDIQLKYVDIAIQKFPNDKSFLLQKANMISSEMDVEQIYEKVLKIDVKDFYANYNLAVIYYNKGGIDEKRGDQTQAAEKYVKAKGFIDVAIIGSANDTQVEELKKKIEMAITRVQ